MCKRTCPACGSTDHYALYGIIGSHITCARCFYVLANRRDYDAAPTNLESDEDILAWVEAGSFVVEGAEAEDPEDDIMYGKQRRELEGLAF